MTYEPKISLPHRYCVRYQQDDLTVEFETESTAHALILYTADPKVVEGTLEDSEDIAAKVLAWLRRKFDRVEVDTSAKPEFGTE